MVNRAVQEICETSDQAALTKRTHGNLCENRVSWSYCTHFRIGDAPDAQMQQHTRHLADGACFLEF
jgi:hypothetical protein